MTRDEMIKFIKENPFVNITHDLFSTKEFIYADNNGLVYDENGYLFEDWDRTINKWSGNNGIRLRSGGSWEDGWYIKE